MCLSLSECRLDNWIGTVEKEIWWSDNFQNLKWEEEDRWMQAVEIILQNLMPQELAFELKGEKDHFKVGQLQKC